VPDNVSTRVQEARESILRSARREIERNGILGLRVADVAEGANCSITQIYRYFTDRDGLLAQVLGDLYEEILTHSSRAYRETLFRHDTISVDLIVESLPRVFDPAARRGQQLRLQILAASVTNAPLRSRLEAITKAEARVWDEGLDEIERRLPTGESFDRRMFTMFLSNLLPYYRMLMGDEGYSQEEFQRFFRDKLSS
jgi:AcrR family transcriptional regulator